MKKNYCFMHNALMGNYIEVDNLILDNIVNSGLYNDIEKIYICNLGIGDYKYKENYDKIEYIDIGDDLHLYEYPTLQFLYNFVKKNTNTNIFYLNNYGVSHSEDKYFGVAKSWREILIHFNIKNYKKCINDLCYYDVSGADWQILPLKHFCGNWWWANSEYINTLMDIEDSKKIIGIPTIRHGAEMWIGSNHNVNPNGNFVHEFNWRNKPLRTNWMDYVKK